jgi:tetratricopeptide (TPR) repeat protein
VLALLLLASLPTWTQSAALLGIQPAVPEIPPAVLETFSPEFRTEIERTLQHLQQNPADSRSAGELAMLFHANGHLAAAEALYSLARQGAPGEFRWAYYLGVVRDAANRAAEAEAAYREAHGLDAAYVPLTLRLAELAASAGRHSEAAALYQEVLQRFPDLAVAHFGLGRAFQQAGQRAEAIAHLRRACELHPTYGAAHYALARELQASGQGDEAQRHLEQYQRFRLNRAVVGDSLLNEVERLKTGSRKALDLLAQGVAAGERGEIEHAIQLHREALELSPDLLQASVNLLILLGKAGRFEELAAVFERAAAQHPSADELHYNYGVALMQNHRPVEAGEAFRRTLQINPLHPQAHNNLGSVLELEGNWQEAEAHYRSALDSRPDFRLARFNLARMLLRRQQIDPAISELERIQSPDDQETPRYLYALAAAWVRKGDLARGRELSLQALEKARRYGQTDLIAALERDLAKLEGKVTR